MFSALPRLIKLLLSCRAPPPLNGKPNICLPLATALEGSPWPKTKRGTLLFVWGSCSAVVSSDPLMIGLVGCVSPSQTEGWRWLIGWYIQSSLDFWGSGEAGEGEGNEEEGLIWREPSRKLRFKITSKYSSVTTLLRNRISQTFVMRLLGCKILGAVQCWKHSPPLLGQSLFLFLTAAAWPQSLKRS